MSMPQNAQRFLNEARQLLRIAQMEFGGPMETASALIWGEDETAQELAKLLSEDALKTTLANAKSPLEQTQERYDLLVLLCPMPNERFETMIAPGGLVLDAVAQKSGEWVVFDQSASYRRVRVLSLMR